MAGPPCGRNTGAVPFVTSGSTMRFVLSALLALVTLVLKQFIEWRAAHSQVKEAP